MLTQEDTEERQERLAQEARDIEQAHKDLVKCVLSNTRIDPKYKGQKVEFFKSYEDEVSTEQIKALTRGKYYQAFKHFLNIWKELPKKQRPELYEVVEMFNTLSRSTTSMYRLIEDTEKKKKHELSDAEILHDAPFLYHITWNDKTSGFDVSNVSEALNQYLAIGIDAPFVDKTILKLCATRAYDEQRAKAKDVSLGLAEKMFGKSTYMSIFGMVAFKILGVLIPAAIYVGIDLWIIFAAMDHLSGEKFSLWAWAGMLYVAVTAVITLIHLGTHGTRKVIETLGKPTMPTGDTDSINADLWAMNREVNAYPQGHINLRLVREQLARLQNTDIKFPVQLLTLIDRSIAKGVHYW